MVFEKTENIMALQDTLLKTIAELVERRDGNTGGHIERTQKYVKVLIDGIEKSGLYSEEIRKLNINLLLQSCQLHDVGKISISDNLLNKPGKLEADEYEEVKKHLIYGEEIISKIAGMSKESDFLNYAKIFAMYHHERWDGTGYPRGLKGSEIPFLGQIMAIADVYDAIVSERPYKKAYTHEDAVRIITEGSGTQFDPALIKVFVNVAEEFK
jgi:putative two-component system response regulator